MVPAFCRLARDAVNKQSVAIRSPMRGADSASCQANNASDYKNTPEELKMSLAKPFHARLLTFAAVVASLLCLPGCQKRCANTNLGWVQLGMGVTYTGQPIPLLEETIYKYKGPDYPQKGIPQRISEVLLRQFPEGTEIQALVSHLQSQHFTCQAEQNQTACRLTVMVSIWERCRIFDDTKYYSEYETIDVIISGTKNISKINTEDKLTNPIETGSTHGKL
jgi:hypothetical protein